MCDQALASTIGYPQRGACEVAMEPGDIYRVLSAFIRDLADAGTVDGVVEELSALGDAFGMPHVYIFESRGSGDSQHVEVGRSRGMPQAIVDAIQNSPLLGWAIEVPTPVFLSETADMIARRGMKRAPALATIEGLFVSVRTTTGGAHHYGFAGEHGIANGLSRSLLELAARLAHKRMSSNSWPVRARVSLTPVQSRVLDLAITGLTDAEVGSTLGLATRTVRFHLANMQRKFGVSTRSELIAHAAKDGGVRHT